ncbi:acyl-CoA dehydrogenase family protein [uncultured Phenylobacterium sp.]|uniref:acyl-CoA dehydrogenase family protein n=1 Tax=uncultured Phenylobacterium sp. TaxID=349273 RepID=UPI0025EEC418|nr:acyl-CoA dehydrogenase family protein [uncultured Phenylobacterium sp.]
MTEVNDDAELEAFRAEARAWLEANFPPSQKGRPTELQYSGSPPQGDALLWKQRMAEKGWGVPTWPKEYGGGGLSARAARGLQEEMARIGASNPIYISLGVTMVGPTVLDYGTHEQKLRHLPPIARGEIVWCLGYSEPGAGSDLASLQTRALDKGDHWEISGQKVWTSGANHADWCGVLVRTDPAARKHEGISFIMTDMRQPGVEARPIEMIGGASSFCEVFFSEARAAKDDLLGPLNGGWTVGKRLLQHERASQTGDPVSARQPDPLQDVAKRYVELDEQGRIADADLRTRLTRQLMHEKAHALTIARAHAESRGNASPSNAVSMLKASSTLIAQTRAELTVEMMGSSGLGWAGDGFSRDEIVTVRGWLGGKAISIAGGSYEVQHNIIAKRILNLPDAASTS